ncbi:hypothetical protein [Nocardiopsis dassonvillei]|uniref:hypothetical protein n=1 Tax=Nocardiopsis dassonvillei TaxID=2014 RepID=UPI00366AD839
MPLFDSDTAEWVRETAKWLLGMEIPSADPAAMRRLAAHNDHVAANLEEIKDFLDLVRGKVRTDFSGVAAGYYEASIAQFTAGDNDYIGAGAKTARKASTALGDGAANAEYTYGMAYGQLTQLLLEIAWCIAMAQWTMGASRALIPWFQYIRSVAIQRVLTWLVLTAPSHQITEQLFASLDSIIQRAQIDAGTRRFHDKELTRLTHGGAGLSGLISAGFSGVVDGLFSHQVRDLLRTNLDTLADIPPPPRLDPPPFPRTGTTPDAAVPHPVPGPGINRDLADVFTGYERDLAATFNPPAGKSAFDNPLVNNDFRDDLADVFATHYGSALGATGARALGNDYADTLMAHWGRPDLTHRLADLLDATPLPSTTRTHLARTVPTTLTQGMGDYMTRPAVKAEIVSTGAASGALEGYLGEGTTNALLTDQGWQANGYSATAGAFQSTFQNVTVDTALSAVDHLHRPPSALPVPPTGTADDRADDDPVPGTGRDFGTDRVPFDGPAPSDHVDTTGTAPYDSWSHIPDPLVTSADEVGRNAPRPAGDDASHGRFDGDDVLYGDNPSAPTPAPTADTASGPGHATPAGSRNPAGVQPTPSGHGAPEGRRPSEADPVHGRGDLRTGDHAGTRAPVTTDTDTTGEPPIRASGAFSPAVPGGHNGAEHSPVPAADANGAVSGSPVLPSPPDHGRTPSAHAGQPSATTPEHGDSDAGHLPRAAPSRSSDHASSGDRAQSDHDSPPGRRSAEHGSEDDAGDAPSRGYGTTDDDFYAPAPTAPPGEPADPDDPWNGNPPTTPDFSALADPKTAKEGPLTVEEAIAGLTDPGYRSHDLDTIGRLTADGTPVFTMDVDSDDSDSTDSDDGSGDPEHLPDAPHHRSGGGQVGPVPAPAPWHGSDRDHTPGTGMGETVRARTDDQAADQWAERALPTVVTTPGSPEPTRAAHVLDTTTDRAHSLWEYNEHARDMVENGLATGDVAPDDRDEFGWIVSDIDTTLGTAALPVAITAHLGADHTLLRRLGIDPHAPGDPDRVAGTVVDLPHYVWGTFGTRAVERAPAYVMLRIPRGYPAAHIRPASPGRVLGARGARLYIHAAYARTGEPIPGARAEDLLFIEAEIVPGHWTPPPGHRPSPSGDAHHGYLPNPAPSAATGQSDDGPSPFTAAHDAPEPMETDPIGLLDDLDLDDAEAGDPFAFLRDTETTGAADPFGTAADDAPDRMETDPIGLLDDLDLDDAETGDPFAFYDPETVGIDPSLLTGAGDAHDLPGTDRLGPPDDQVPGPDPGEVDAGDPSGLSGAAAPVPRPAGASDGGPGTAVPVDPRTVRAVKELHGSQFDVLVALGAGRTDAEIITRHGWTPSGLTVVMGGLTRSLGLSLEDREGVAAVAAATGLTDDSDPGDLTPDQRGQRALTRIHFLRKDHDQILTDYLEGKTLREIAVLRGTHRKSVENLFSRLKYRLGVLRAKEVADAARAAGWTSRPSAPADDEAPRAVDRITTLSDPEFDFLVALGAGRTDAEITARHGWRSQRLATLLRGVTDSLGLRPGDREGAAAVAVAAGLTDDTDPGDLTPDQRRQRALTRIRFLRQEQHQALTYVADGLKPGEIAQRTSSNPNSAGVLLTGLVHRLGVLGRDEARDTARAAELQAPPLPTLTEDQRGQAVDRISTLGEFEFGVLVALGSGDTDAEITDRHGWSLRGFTTALSGITDALGLPPGDRAGVVDAAVAAGLTDDTDPGDLTPDQRRQRAVTRIRFLPADQRELLTHFTSGLSPSDIARLPSNPSGVNGSATRANNLLARLVRRLGVLNRNEMRDAALATGLEGPRLSAPTAEQRARTIDRITTLSDPEFELLTALGAGRTEAEITARPGWPRTRFMIVMRGITNSLGLHASDRAGVVDAAVAAGLADDTDPGDLTPDQRRQRALTRIRFLRQDQRRILVHLAEGYRTDQIAEQTDLNPITLKDQPRKLVHRLGMLDFDEMTAAAREAPDLASEREDLRATATEPPAPTRRRPTRATATRPEPTRRRPARATATRPEATPELTFEQTSRAVDQIDRLNEPQFEVFVHLGAGLSIDEIVAHVRTHDSAVTENIRNTSVENVRERVTRHVRRVVATLNLNAPGDAVAVVAAAGLAPTAPYPQPQPQSHNDEGEDSSDGEDNSDSDDDLYDADDRPPARRDRGPRDDDPPAPPTGGGTGARAEPSARPGTGNSGATAADRSTGGSSDRRGAGSGNRTRRGTPPADHHGDGTRDLSDDHGTAATGPDAPELGEPSRPSPAPNSPTAGSTTAEPPTTPPHQDFTALFSSTLNPSPFSQAPHARETDPPRTDDPADDPEDDFYAPAPAAHAQEPAPADPDDPWGGNPPTGPDLGALVAADKKDGNHPPTVEDVVADLAYRYRLEDIGHHTAQDARTQVFMAGDHRRRHRHRAEADSSGQYADTNDGAVAETPDPTYPEGTQVSRYPAESPAPSAAAYGEQPAASTEETAQARDGDQDERIAALMLWNGTFAGVEDLAETTGFDVVSQQGLVEDGSDGSTTLMRFANGAQAVYKDTEGATFARDRADAEQLASLVGRAIGANVPGVLRIGETEVFMHFMNGESGFTHLDNPRSPLLNTRDGHVLGLLDLLIANGDRNPGNWLDQGRGHVAGIDHGKAWFKYEYTPEDPTDLEGLAYTNGMRPFYDFDANAWIANPLTRADIRFLRARLAGLSGEFARLGRSDWFDEMMERLDMLANNARGTTGLFSGGGR